MSSIMVTDKDNSDIRYYFVKLWTLKILLFHLLESRLARYLLLSGQLQRVKPKEWIMYKSRWGAFYNTILERHLHNLGVNTIVVCGCNFPNCPRTNIYEASERDFRIVPAKDATSVIYDIGLLESET